MGEKVERKEGGEIRLMEKKCRSGRDWWGGEKTDDKRRVGLKGETSRREKGRSGRGPGGWTRKRKKRVLEKRKVTKGKGERKERGDRGSRKKRRRERREKRKRSIEDGEEKGE
jgi:hypothetical protein